MRKLLLTAGIFLCFLLNASSQTVNDIPIKDIDVEYVQIVGTSRLLSSKLTIEIDFGQENKLFSSDKDTRVKDANGKNMIFNSMIDALNFMTKSGYEFVQAYAISVSNQNVYHYLLRKKRTN
ncbi:MAG TPA: hypothetical protein VGB46_09625 [Flavisolibacter sp.]|jgi:hypothetical protein